MVKQNLNNVDEPEEEFESYEDDNPTESYEEEPTGEKYDDKTILDKLVDTEIILKNLQRSMEGLELINDTWKQVRLPIARDKVIASIINSLRSIINPGNSFSYITEKEAKVSIYEKIIEFEYMAVEEITISHTQFESLINMCDHSLELFYGKVIDGHLTNALKDIFAGTHTQKEKTTTNSLFNVDNLLGIKK